MLQRVIKQAKDNRGFLIFLIAILIIILIVGIFYNQQFEKKVVIDYQNQMNMLADLKSTQIALWRQERILDGQIIQTDFSLAQNVVSYLNNPLDLYIAERIQDRMETFLLNPNYRALLIVDDDGAPLLHVGDLPDQSMNDIQQSIQATGTNQAIQLSDLRVTGQGSHLMELIAPILQSADKTQSPIAYMVLLINPDVVLFPLVESHPTTLATAETLLVRKDDNFVLFLNDLRYQDNPGIHLKIPLTDTNVLAVKAILGQTGNVIGVDYRGVAVMGVIAPVTDTNWILIAKMDREEIYQSITNQRLLTGIAILMILISGGFIVATFWRKQSASIKKGLSISETERKNLQTKYETLFNQANDAILLIKEDGQIVDANHKAIDLYGYRKDELLTMNIYDLRESSEKDIIQSDMNSVKDGRVNSFETVHRTKNGDQILVEVSSRFVSIGGEGYFQSLIRNITEKKKAEQSLLQSEMELKKAQQISHVGSWLYDVSRERVFFSDEVNRILAREKQTEGYDIETLVKEVAFPGDIQTVLQLTTEAYNQKQNYSFEVRILRPDGTERTIWVEVGDLNTDQDQHVVSVSGIVQDITEKKAAEREIKKNDALLQRIFEILPIGLWITDKEGNLIRSNKMVNEIWGKEILVGINGFDVFHGRRLPSREEIKPDDWASVHTIREGVTVRDEMIEIDAYDGKTKTILNYSTPILDENGQLQGSVILNLDISELKKAEQQLSEQLDELRRWNLATLGRENRIRELKVEINRLLTNSGQDPRYKSVLDESHE